MDVRSLRHIIGFFVDKGDIASAEQAIEKITGKIAMIGAGLTAAFTVPLSLLSKKIIDTIGKFERWDISFATMLGDPNEAKDLITEVMEFAAKTPFEIGQSMQSTKMLLAAGFKSENIIDVMTDLGNAAAGADVPITRIIYNFRQVKALGRLMGRDLNDFHNTGIPVLEEVAKVVGKTVSETKKMVSQGKIGFDIVREAFRRMSSEGGRYEDLMLKLSKTLSGEWSNFKDRITLSMLVFREEWLPILKTSLNWISQKFDSLIKMMSPAVIRFITVLGGILSVLGPILLYVATFLGAGTALIGMFAGIKIMTGAFGIAIGALLIKFALLIAAVAAVIAIIALFIDDLWSYAKGQDSLFGEFFGPWNELKPKIMGVINTVWTSLKTVWILLKDFFSGVMMILKGFWQGDVDMFYRGIEEGLNNFLAMVIWLVWDVLIKFVVRFTAIVTYKIMMFLEGLLRRALWLVVGTFQKMVDKAIFYVNKIKSFFSFGLFGGGEAQVTGVLNTPQAAFGAASSTSTNINVNANITTQVPEGTPVAQKNYLEQSTQEIAQRLFAGELRNNIGRNE